MDNFDKPLSEVFDLTKHPWLERTGVAVAFNLTSLAVLGADGTAFGTAFGDTHKIKTGVKMGKEEFPLGGCPQATLASDVPKRRKSLLAKQD